MTSQTITTTDILAEVITLQQAKDYVKINTSADDAMLTDLIKGVREAVEEYCGISIAKKTMTTLFEHLDDEKELELTFAPDQTNIVVKRISDDGTETTLTLNTDYRITGLKTKTVHIFNQYYTGKVYEPAYKVEYIAGYGNDAGNNIPLPESIRTAMFKQIADLYDYRTNDIVGVSASTLSMTTKELLAPYRNIITL